MKQETRDAEPVSTPEGSPHYRGGLGEVTQAVKGTTGPRVQSRHNQHTHKPRVPTPVASLRRIPRAGVTGWGWAARGGLPKEGLWAGEREAGKAADGPPQEGARDPLAKILPP